MVNLKNKKIKEPVFGLLPVPEILYDTEIINEKINTLDYRSINFLERPLGFKFLLNDNITKSKFHTNMEAINTLPCPRKFDIYGFAWDFNIASSFKTKTDEEYEDFLNEHFYVNFKFDKSSFDITSKLSMIPRYNNKKLGINCREWWSILINKEKISPETLLLLSKLINLSYYDLTVIDNNSRNKIPIRWGYDDKLIISLRLNPEFQTLNFSKNIYFTFMIFGMYYKELI